MPFLTFESFYINMIMHIMNTSCIINQCQMKSQCSTFSVSWLFHIDAYGDSSTAFSADPLHTTKIQSVNCPIDF